MFGIKCVGTYIFIVSVSSVCCLSLGGFGRRSTDIERSLLRLRCLVDYCSELRGEQLPLCFGQHCIKEDANPLLTQDAAVCLSEKCSSIRDRLTFLACGVVKCLESSNLKHKQGTVNDRGYLDNRVQQQRGFRVDRRFNEGFFWPDEMETRSVRDAQSGVGGEDDQGEAKRDIEHNKPVKPQGCSMECHGFSGRNYDDCVKIACNGDKIIVGGDVLHPVKRWTTRLCMETHCKGTSNQVEFFLCGKQYCHN